MCCRILYSTKLLNIYPVSLYLRFTRTVFDESGKWARLYKKETRIDLEKFWIKQLSKKWKEKLKTCSTLPTGEKYYCLSMFPYPSGKLHMGHVRVYTISDTMAHYHRMQGKNVIHPMGWDSFGLPAENAAVVNNSDPEKWTDQNISYMKKQLQDLNLCFDWDREFSTCTPEYYQWTQYLFLKLFQAGLAYQKKALVNWDPVDKTVLADEQVDDEGKSWRSGALVEKRLLKQWFLKTTKYFKSLLNTIDEIDEHVGIKMMQRNWIGKPEGVFVDFQLQVEGQPTDVRFSVFCTHPEYVEQGTHINLHSNHAQELAFLFSDAGSRLSAAMLQNLESGLVIDGISAVNPLTNTAIPFVMNDHDYKSSSVLGIPSLNEVDSNIATRNDLKVNHHDVIPSRESSLKHIEALGCGYGHMTSSVLRDWLISRQRRWGTPIPIVHCPHHGAVPVDESKLPVLLPKFNENLEEWSKTKCPVCGGEARREMDTMDTFVDSSWYFMRFTDPHNNNEIFSKEKCNHLMPVDLYIGGKEHAILHLYYARFISHFCADIGLTVHREPFKKLLVQGIIKGKTYRLKNTGKYLSPDDVEETEKGAFEKHTGEEIELSFEKMSKSKLNGVDPVDFVSEWGITLTRLFVLYAAAPHENIHWDTKTDVIPGMMRWQMRLWSCVTNLIEMRNKPIEGKVDFDTEFKLSSQTNKTIKTVTNLFEKTCLLSAAITALLTLNRVTFSMKKDVISNSREYERSVCSQVIMAAPMMPHFASELWAGLRSMKYKYNEYEWDRDVLEQKWPRASDVPTPQALDVWINKKRITRLLLPNNLHDQDELRDYVMNLPKVSKRFKSPITETIFQPNTIKFITATEKPK